MNFPAATRRCDRCFTAPVAAMFATIDSDHEVARFWFHEPWSAPAGPSPGNSPGEASAYGSHVTDDGDDRNDRSVAVDKGKNDERAMVTDSTFFGE